MKTKAELILDGSTRRRRRPLRAVMWMLGVSTILIVLWSTFIVLDARRRTPQVLAALETSRPMTLTLASLPAGYLDLLLTIQDPKFYRHHGVDLLPRPGRLTTVTQALVKYLYFEPYERGVVNKLRQTLIAVFALDPLTTKERQLTLFINTAHLGGVNGWPVRGFDQAAQMYFGRGLAELSENEFLGLVAMLDAPTTYSLAAHPDANAERVTQLRASLEKQRS
jgi:membrane carboxypeptidase/penicillin-binding protein